MKSFLTAVIIAMSLALAATAIAHWADMPMDDEPVRWESN